MSINNPSAARLYESLGLVEVEPGVWRKPSAAFVARWKGQTFRLTARDAMHARIIAYMAVWPEAKWNEVSAYAA